MVCLGKVGLLCCSSNTATDNASSKVDRIDPSSKAIRFHSISEETSALKRKVTATQKKLAASKLGDAKGPSNVETFSDPRGSALENENAEEASDDEDQDEHASSNIAYANVISLCRRLASQVCPHGSTQFL